MGTDQKKVMPEPKGVAARNAAAAGQENNEICLKKAARSKRTQRSFRQELEVADTETVLRLAKSIMREYDETFRILVN